MARLTIGEKLKRAGIRVNDEQLNVVRATSGPCVCVAGPGTGKTSTLVAKVKYTKLVDECSSVLVVSFTKKSVGEIQERLAGSGNMILTATFHSWFYRILCNHGFRGCRFLENEKQKTEILKGLINSLGVKVKVEEVSEAITKGKFSPDTNKVFGAYLEYLKRYRLMDFDSIQYFLLDLLVKYPELAIRIGTSYDYIFIDEAQDISKVQYEIITRLWNRNSNISFFGDEKQSIYSFRGGEYGVMRDLRKFFNAKRFNLSTSYRCPASVLAVANYILPGEDTLKAFKDNGKAPIFISASSPKAEALTIISQIQRKYSSGQKYGDMAVLFRSSTSISILYEELINSGIPFVKLGSDGSRWNNSKNKVFISVLALINNKGNKHYLNCCRKIFKDDVIVQDILDFQPNSGDLHTISVWIYEKWLKDYWQDDGSILEDWLSEIEDFPSYRDLAANIYKMRQQARKMAKLLSDPKADYVRMLSIHSAKGLEFKSVFLAAASDNVLPCSGHPDVDEAEERRLAYVAVTRSMDDLFISYPKTYKSNVNAPSRFLAKFFDK